MVSLDEVLASYYKTKLGTLHTFAQADLMEKKKAGSNHFRPFICVIS
jgi:hypothetical protein